VVRISHRYKFIFFSFPKCGSESVRMAINPLSDIRGKNALRAGLGTDGQPRYPDHMRPVEVRNLFARNGWPFDEYFSFVTVRNPWSRLVSLYRMIQSFNKPHPIMPFSDWLLATRTDGHGGSVGIDPAQLWARYGAYSLDNFVCDEHGRRLVDQVFRMEDIHHIPGELRRHGIPLDVDLMPRRNSRTPVDLDMYYRTPALKAVVAARYAKDIAEFGYRYEPNVAGGQTAAAAARADGDRKRA